MSVVFVKQTLATACLDTAGVTGSNPVAPTIFYPIFSYVTIVSQQRELKDGND